MEKLSVKIYGQEYTITGDRSQTYMARVAEYVDEKMKQLSGVLPNGSISELAALAAVNIADELFANEHSAAEIKNRNEQLENDTHHYISLWEEAKKSFLLYKDEAQTVRGEKEDLQGRFEATRNEAERLSGLVRTLEERVKALESENAGLLTALRTRESEQDGLSEQLRELESKSREIESGFFDLQMENIQLKGELDRYRRMVE
ncbi:MAG: cell division protein ZapA [Clostridiales Family XIII bacterium]|jgi:cell division protein ZapA|nr:cell division protein ZapA [Clostridiales Family XIII bacterium]